MKTCYVSNLGACMFSLRDWVLEDWAGSEGKKIRITPVDNMVSPWEDIIKRVYKDQPAIILKNSSMYTGEALVELV